MNIRASSGEFTKIAFPERERFRYTPTTCFETFPFPEPNEQQKIDISTAAKELNELRENWLNPPEWTMTRVLEFPGATDGPWSRFVVDPDARGIGTVRYPCVEPRNEECAKKLAKRTLTNLYNKRPAGSRTATQDSMPRWPPLTALIPI